MMKPSRGEMTMKAAISSSLVMCRALKAAWATTAPASPPTQICHEDTPTGTRFSRVRCFTPEQEAERQKNGERVADEMRNIRPAARDLSK